MTGGISVCPSQSELLHFTGCFIELKEMKVICRLHAECQIMPAPGDTVFEEEALLLIFRVRFFRCALA